MGCLPKYVPFIDFEDKNFTEFTIDPDYEQNTFQELIRLLNKLDEDRAGQSAELSNTEV